MSGHVGEGFRGRQKRPLTRLGAAVVQEMVELIVTGAIEPGELLPPEGPLAEQFGVSRTVIRESVKRLQEKGLVIVAQGRGTQVTGQASWSMLDPSVLSALIDNDDSVDILTELTAVRASLEAMMAGAVAAHHTDAALARLRSTLDTMRETESDEDAFFQADVVFHFALMEASGNRLAHNITKSLYRRALESRRYRGQIPSGALRSTLEEHTAIYAAIAAGDVVTAEHTMRQHIEVGWERRRLTHTDRIIPSETGGSGSRQE